MQEKLITLTFFLITVSNQKRKETLPLYACDESEARSKAEYWINEHRTYFHTHTMKMHPRDLSIDGRFWMPGTIRIPLEQLEKEEEARHKKEIS
jgi:hypothetical protein